MKKIKGFTHRRLYNLWIKWLDKHNINAQELFKRYNLEGSFIYWLEKNYPNEKINIKEIK